MARRPAALNTLRHLPPLPVSLPRDGSPLSANFPLAPEPPRP
jgi:hypothetical protein